MQGLALQNGNKDSTIFGGGWTWLLSVGSPYFFLRCFGLGLHSFQRCFVTGRGLRERCLHKLGAGIPLEVNQWNGLWKKHSCVYKTKPAECIYNKRRIRVTLSSSSSRLRLAASRLAFFSISVRTWLQTCQYRAEVITMATYTPTNLPQTHSFMKAFILNLWTICSIFMLLFW